MSTEQFLEIGDGKVFVKIWHHQKANESSIAPLFLLHDSLGCVETWRDFPALLSNKLQTTVIAYDRLGFGRSTTQDTLPSFNFIQEEANIYFPRIRSLLGISDFTVMGHSVGGCMALLSAVNCPTNKVVITESAPVINENITIHRLKQAKKSFSSPEKIERLKKYHGEKAEWVLRAWTDIWLAPEFAHWNMKNDLTKIKSPVLILHGDKDEYGSLALPELIHKAVRGYSEMKILKGIGHVPHREIQSDILEMVAAFLIRNF